MDVSGSRVWLRRIEVLCFAYGAVAAILALGWLLATAFSPDILPNEERAWPKVRVLLVASGGILVVTFHRHWSPGLWMPVLTVNRPRVRVAQAVLGIAFMGVIALTVALPKRPGFGHLLLPGLAATISLYVTAHWALRPENLFPRSFLEFMRFPLAGLLVPLFRRVWERRTPRTSFDEWISEMVLICEFVSDPNAVRLSWIEGRPNPPDLPDFATLYAVVFDILESDVCLRSYRARLGNKEQSAVAAFLDALRPMEPAAAIAEDDSSALAVMLESPEWRKVVEMARSATLTPLSRIARRE